jgi:quercetin dioxygenase-like cupin family protein
MPVIRRSETPATEDRGNLYTGLATRSSGAMELVLVHTQKKPGATTVAHSHDREEIVFVVAGQASISIGFEAERLGPGDTAIIPPGSVHQLSVLGDEDFEAVLAKPSGIKSFSPDGNELPEPDWMR